MIENVWDFYSAKGTKTIFVSVGTGSSCLPDLEFAETIGCPILKIDTPADLAKWQDVKDILKSRKPTETTSDFAKVASRKWVLPKNLVLQDTIPSLYNGTLEHEGQPLKTKQWYQLLKEHCMSLGLPEEETHIDVLKLDKTPFEDYILSSLWQTGFRPSLLLINWCDLPDSCLQTTLTAGHLQMLGYALVAKEGTKFLYYYTDTNYYETTSWEGVAKKFENPFVAKLVQSVYPGTEGSVLQFPLDK